jgi:pimeloyl-ACP methyl ester carboxylesterase
MSGLPGSVLETQQCVQRSVGTNPQIAYTLYEPPVPVSAWQLVFLAGVGHQQTCWNQMALHLARCGIRCLSLDYRAHGASKWTQPVQAVTLDDCVADLAAVLDAEQIDPRQLVPVGHSYGGGVAQRYAQQHPTAGLVLIGTLALGLWWKDVLRQLPYQLSHHPRLYSRLATDPSVLFSTERRAREYLFGKDAPDDVVQWYLNECWCPASGLALQHMLFAKSLPLRTRHILFLAGRQDTSVSLRLIRQSAARLQAPLVELEGPHDGMLADGWQLAAEVVRAWVQQWHDQVTMQGGAA